MRLHPAIRECAVVGIPDESWGERVAMCIESDAGELTLDVLRNWAKAHLAPYKLPTRLLIVDELPRNSLGKVHKPTVRRLFQDSH
jgi:malonyl-CoA/methylmalonyl-CoA synthetase